MFRILFIFFIIIPIIEISVLLQVGELLGMWPTLAIVIITAWLGAKNVRLQGLATMQSVQIKMAQGQMPSDEIVAGLLLLIAGVLLVTPGFVTDIFGLLLLIPTFRQWFVSSVQKHLVTRQFNAQHSAQYQAYEQQNPFQPSINTDDLNTKTNNQDTNTPRQGETLEGEFERKE